MTHCASQMRIMHMYITRAMVIRIIIIHVCVIVMDAYVQAEILLVKGIVCMLGTGVVSSDRSASYGPVATLVWRASMKM